MSIHLEGQASPPRRLPYLAMLDGRKRVYREVNSALRAEMSARLRA